MSDDDKYRPREFNLGPMRPPFEGPLPRDYFLGPKEREALLPEAPPLKRADIPAEECAGRPLAAPDSNEGSSPGVEAVTTRDEGNVVQMRLNGYCWPRELVFPKKASGSP